jgi:hypothetical protein
MEKTRAIPFQGRGSSSIHRRILYLNNKGHSYAITLSKIKQRSLIKSLRDSVIPVLRSVYFTEFESILKYGIIFWGRSE